MEEAAEGDAVEAADELARSLRRAVSTLLHTPTVRMKELAVDPEGTRYAAALHRLFDLDPEAIESLVVTDDVDPVTPGTESAAGLDPLVDAADIAALKILLTEKERDD